jgi:WD40 repeat protein
MANLAPLQIYCSGLVFAPVSSTIRRVFENSQVGLQFLPQINNSWSAELQTLEGHSKEVTSVAFSEDGQIIVSGSQDHTIRIWDVNSGLEIRKLEGHSGPVNSVAFSSEDIHILASGSDDCTIKLWNIKTGLLIQSLIVSEPVNLVTSLSANRSIMASSSGPSITVWNIQDNSEIWTCKHPGNLRFWPEKVNLLVFSSDGQTLVSAGKNDIQIWDVKTGSEIPRTRESPNSTNCSSERRLIPLGGGGISVLDMKTGLETMKMMDSLRNRDWGSLAIAQQKQIVAGGSRWNDIVLWDINTGKQIRKLKSHSAGILSMAFSEDCQILASSSSDCTIKLWDVETSLKVEKVNGHLSEITSVVVSIDGEMIASAGGDIKLWDAKTGTELRTLRGHSYGLHSLAFSKDGEKLISGALDSTAKLWDVKTGSELHTLKHGYMVCSVAFSADDRMVATGSGTNTVKLWDTMTGSEISTLEGPVPPDDEGEVSPIVRSIVFSSDGNMVAAAVEEGEIRLWNMHSQSEIRTIDCGYGGFGLLNSLAFSRDGEILVVGSYDNIEIWDIKTGSKLRQMGFRKAEWVALSEDEQMVIAGSNQNGIKIWDINTGLETRVRKDDLTDRNGAGASCQITVDQDWIEFEGEPILWLPKKYRHYSCSVSQKSTAVLGYPSGQVLIMKFS